MSKTPTLFVSAVLGFAVVAFCQKEFPVISTPASYNLLKKTTDTPYDRIPSTPTNITRKNTAPRCGEVLTASNGGGVFYKTFEQVDHYERCVWIIAAPNATGYTINILHLGSPTNHPGSSQELIITGIRWQEYQHGGPILSSYKPTSVGSIDVYQTNLLLVTFLSERADIISNGFALQYQETLSGTERDTSIKSTHHLFDSRVFKFKYPVGSSSYDVFELAAFIFLPQNNIYTGHDNLLWYELAGLESDDHCHDGFSLYKFNNDVPEGSEKWQHTKTLCANVTTYEMIHDDLTLGLFVSDQSAVSSGFSLYYSGCPF